MVSCKIVLLGEGGVGKSAFAIQFVNRTFVQKYDPTIEDSFQTSLNIDDKPVTVEILDTAGQEEFLPLRDQHIKSGDGYGLIFSITSTSSFEKLPMFFTSISQMKEHTHPPLVVIGNKCDLDKERTVSFNEGTEYAKSISAPYFEGSAKNRVNVDEAFTNLIRLTLKHKEKTTQNVPQPKPTKDKRKKCTII